MANTLSGARAEEQVLRPSEHRHLLLRRRMGTLLLKTRQ
jgi:hypothetical protein